MARYERFTILCDSNERRAIAELATYLHRSQSDAVRYVVVMAVRNFIIAEATAQVLQSQTTEEQKEPEGGEYVSN